MIYISEEGYKAYEKELVASIPNMSGEFKEISINSPLGACMYKHKAGEELE